jgi:hypothetical protein
MQEEEAVWGVEALFGGGFSSFGALQGEPDFGGSSDAGACTYAVVDSPEVCGIAGSSQSR